MRKILTIAAREYNAAVRTKSFLVMLVLMPIMMASGGMVSYVTRTLKDTGEMNFAVIDRTPGEKIYPFLDLAVKKRNELSVRDEDTGKQTQPIFVLERVAPSSSDPQAIRQQRYELSQRVHKGELYGFLEIGSDVLEFTKSLPTDAALRPPKDPSDKNILRYQSSNLNDGVFFRWAERVVNAAIHTQRSVGAGLTLEQILGVLQPVPLLTKGLNKRNPETGAIEEPTVEGRVAHFVVPVAIMSLMFMITLIGVQPLMQGVVEEKMQRIAEVLLGSVRPFELMMGKLLGMTGVSLTIACIYLAGAYYLIYRNGWQEHVPVHLIAWFAVFQVLAMLMYGALFIAIGAAASDTKETQTLGIPVMFLVVMPMFFLMPIVEKPNSGFALALSLFPPATPMIMITRLAVPPGVPLWQPLLGVCGSLAATTFCVWAAGRIFRVGLLLQGKGVRFGDLFRWVLAG